MGEGDGVGGAAAAVVAAAPAPGAGPCLLLDLEKKPLLKVFVFLNAGEVLRAAQVCRPMFRKVIGFSGWSGARGTWLRCCCPAVVWEEGREWAR